MKVRQKSGFPENIFSLIKEVMPFSLLHPLHSPVLTHKGNLGTGCSRSSSSFLCVQTFCIISILSAGRFKENSNTSYFFISTDISLHSPCNICCPPAIFSSLKSDIAFLILLLFPPCFPPHPVYPYPSLPKCHITALLQSTPFSTHAISSLFTCQPEMDYFKCSLNLCCFPDRLTRNLETQI